MQVGEPARRELPTRRVTTGPGWAPPSRAPQSPIAGSGRNRPYGSRVPCVPRRWFDSTSVDDFFSRASEAEMVERRVRSRRESPRQAMVDRCGWYLERPPQRRAPVAIIDRRRHARAARCAATHAADLRASCTLAHAASCPSGGASRGGARSPTRARSGTVGRSSSRQAQRSRARRRRPRLRHGRKRRAPRRERTAIGSSNVQRRLGASADGARLEARGSRLSVKLTSAQPTCRRRRAGNHQRTASRTISSFATASTPGRGVGAGPSAESKGFEPLVPLRAHLISNQAPSATRSALHRARSSIRHPMSSPGKARPRDSRHFVRRDARSVTWDRRPQAA